MHAELVLDTKNILGEGPWWDSDKQKLHWIDIEDKRIYSYKPQSKEYDYITVNQLIGSAAPTNSSRKLLCAMQNGFYMLDLQTGRTEHIYDPEPGIHDNRFNDGKCDPAGRFWAGTMNMEGKSQRAALYCLDSKTGCRKVLSQVSISNGLCWSPDHRTMYYIDTPTREIVSFPYDLKNGTLGEKKAAVSFPAGQGVPDGMTIDVEGMIWVASWGGGHVSRWDPSTGKCLETIRVPASQVTSCTFGGENMDELYITSARVGLDEKALNNEPSAGGIFRIKTKTKGLPAYKYDGA
ncbi:SMP-30/gluconolaconase/LRE domain protein [Virgibacillus indicus]|uniref:Regucalcin n=1 Tax=Virgibacillus indicus TaxID=2024554 RepID=A0A265NAK7_9BACI|nr:SMP-30/gluconolaconase/LRE domain protein [Virgibacillus indicus]